MKIEDKILTSLEHLAYTVAAMTLPFIVIVNSKGESIKSLILIVAVIALILCGIDAKVSRNNKIKNYKRIEMIKLLNLKTIK